MAQGWVRRFPRSKVCARVLVGAWLVSCAWDQLRRWLSTRIPFLGSLWANSPPILLYSGDGRFAGGYDLGFDPWPVAGAKSPNVSHFRLLLHSQSEAPTQNSHFPSCGCTAMMPKLSFLLKFPLEPRAHSTLNSKQHGFGVAARFLGFEAKLES